MSENPVNPPGGGNTQKTRRATVDDLPKLSAFWRAAHIPDAEVEKLEKLFTDFQVAVDEKGEVVGALGLQIEGKNGRIYSESFADFALADTLRPALWGRLQTVGQNHGLFRLWTQEEAPWWKKDAGFSAPTEEVLQKLPEKFGPRQSPWLTLRLKDEAADPDLLDKEFALFKESENAKREAMVQQGRILKAIATLISALLFILGIVALYYVLKNRR